MTDASFQEVNRPFKLSFENNVVRTGHTEYYLPNLEIKDYKVMIDGWNFLDQPVKNDISTQGNIRKFAAG